MFMVEVIAGLFSHSTSVLADSLDMLGDTFVYAFSLYVLNKSVRWQAKASLAKGVTMAFFGLAVLAEATAKYFNGVVPNAPVMTYVGIAALLMNGLCFWLLWQYRADNLNMRSTWLCSRNDVIANIAVIGAGLLTFQFSSLYPDLIVGTLIAIMFLRSAWGVIKESRAELKMTLKATTTEKSYEDVSSL
jgi:cation diffusion facilitator family transporter